MEEAGAEVARKSCADEYFDSLIQDVGEPQRLLHVSEDTQHLPVSINSIHHHHHYHPGYATSPARSAINQSINIYFLSNNRKNTILHMSA